MYISVLVVILLTLFGRDLSDCKLYVLLAVVSFGTWIMVPNSALAFTVIATAQTMVMWIVIDLARQITPARFSIQWQFGGQRLILAVI